MLFFLLSCQVCFEEEPCSVGLGQYHILPPNSTPESIWFFFHGWNGAPSQYIGKSYINDVLNSQNVMLVLPKGKGKTWSMENMGGEDSLRDEEQFVFQILDDIHRTKGVDELPIYMGGFSLGGALSEYLACSTNFEIEGVYPISGGFWDPVPDECATDIDVRHVHGENDTTWPFEGRRVGTGTQAHQQDIQDMWKRNSHCSEETEVTTDGPLTCTSWLGCSDRISWCLHSEGHTRLPGWFSRMILSMNY